MRRHMLKAGGVKVEIRTPDLSTFSRQQQLPHPSDAPEVISQAALQLIRSNGMTNSPVRMLTITGISLTDEDDPEQLSFFGFMNDKIETKDDGPDLIHEKLDRVGRTVDGIREKFGDSAITYGRIIGNDLGFNKENNAKKGSDD